MIPSFANKFLAWLAAALLAVPLRAQVSLPGQASVTDAGAGTFTVPLQLPPGRAGVEPKLSFSYSNQAGNGLLGIGWNLAGLSSVTRCPRTLSDDGVRGDVNFETTDRYCLDGQRLMLVSGADGADNAEYRTGREAFSKIIAHNESNVIAGHAYFVAKTRDGLTMEYGRTADARMFGTSPHQAKIISWALNRVTDTHGNQLIVRYDAQPGEALLPIQLEYGANPAAGAPHTASVSLLYEARPDTSVAYHLGSVTRVTRRLSSAEVRANGALVSTYALSYDSSPSTKRSRLVKIVQCAVKCLPALDVAWLTDGEDFDIKAGFPNSDYAVGANDYKYLVGDFNGDGKSDLVHLVNPSYVHVWLSNGDGTFSITPGFPRSTYRVDSNYYRFETGDFNGDGKTDLVHFVNSRYVHVWLSVGDGTFDIRAPFYPENGAYDVSSNNYRYLSGDFNGDGRTDLVHLVNGRYVHTWFSNGDGTFTIQQPFPNTGYDVSANDYRFQTGDFNGDGRTDLVHFANPSVLVLWFSNGDGTFFINGSMPEAGYAVNANDYRFQTGDFNGDGKTDLIHFAHPYYVRTWIASGWDFTIAPPFPNDGQYSVGANNYGFQTGDFNGDGRTDLVHFASPQYIHLWLSTGNGQFTITNPFPKVPWGVGMNNYKFVTADFNGDGKSDFLHLVNNSYAQMWMKNTAGQQPDGIQSIQEQGKTRAKFAFKPITQPDVYSRSISPVYPSTSPQFPMYVTSSLSVADGLGGLRSTSHTYGNLLAEATSGRGLLGFEWTQVDDLMTGIRSKNWFRLDHPFVGLKRESIQSTSSGPLAHTLSQYGCYDFDGTQGCQVAPGKRYFVYQTGLDEKAWDLKGVALPGKRTETTYDCASAPVKCFGNATRVTIRTLDTAGNPTAYVKETTSEFLDDEANWMIGRLLRSRVASQTP